LAGCKLDVVGTQMGISLRSWYHKLFQEFVANGFLDPELKFFSEEA